MPYIYKITNNINSKVYIGQTCREILVRWNEHLRNSLVRDNKLYRAMKKYGRENFSIEIIEEVIQKQLSDKEKEWIIFYDSYYNGYNSTFGGEGESSVDIDKLIALYTDYSIQEIEEITGHTRKTISRHLVANNIPIRNSGYYIKQGANGKSVLMLSLNDEEISVFNSMKIAANYILEKGYSKAKNNKSVINKISLVCQNKRQTAFGFKWKYFNI